MTKHLIMLLVLTVEFTYSVQAQETSVDFQQHVQPILTRYCAGCHNDREQQGKFSASSYQSLSRGGEQGNVILAGDPEKSRLIQLISGKLKEKMPPEDEPQPTSEEITLLKSWISSGAKAPDAASLNSLMLNVREVPSKVTANHVTSMAINSHSSMVAQGRYRQLELIQQTEGSAKDNRSIQDLPGKITSLHFSVDDKWLVAGSGVPGLGGYAVIYAVPDLAVIREFRGHADTLYDAELSPDKSILATCSYDKNIILWDTATGGILRELSGHNGAVYDLAFSPDGKYLVSGSADDTCKIWRVADGFRLDTLSQPLKEVHCVSFMKGGENIISTGADQKLRVWNFVSKNNAESNPMVLAQFAHEKPVIKMMFSSDGQHLVTLAVDKSVKLWSSSFLSLIQSYPELPDIPAAVAYSAKENHFLVTCMDGQSLTIKIPATIPHKDEVKMAEITQSDPIMVVTDMKHLNENEPNNLPQEAQKILIPSKISGYIHQPEQSVDEDFFAFNANQGEELVFEVRADRMKSPLDSHLEILTDQGARIERIQMQAVRDSYFTFRGKDDKNSGDFRVFNWEEMKLNQFLYANGEVVKLYMYPRGPDSGFDVYPGTGKRYGYFDTTPLAHALNEPCYIVEPHPPGEVIASNGLPVFKLYYENDDDSQRKSGRDSKLTFRAPYTGKFLVRLRDVRGFAGDSFKYELHARHRAQSFMVTLNTKELSLPAGGAREIKLSADRIDGFEGEITVDFQNIPPGLNISLPIVIEAGQIEALGVLWLDEMIKEITNDELKKIEIKATASIHDQLVTENVAGFSKLTIEKDPLLGVTIQSVDAQQKDVPPRLLEVTMRRGETRMLKLVVNRGNHKGIVEFGKEDSGRNLPFGVYVDNIGLNGLMLLAGQNEREFFITADAAATPQSRLFHLKASTNKGSCSLPVMLHVLP